jgi:phage anti-repressor protein
MTDLNIVDLIEKNPISRLSAAYNNKLLVKIKESFSNFEQQLFVSSFYCYLNYDKINDYVVDLDDVWKWLGFASKFTSIRSLEKYFNLDVDYKNISTATTNDQENPTPDTKEEKWGGHNKQTFMLTIKCFKSLCLKAQTKKASEIHEYYMKMEEMLHQIVEEETDELRLQLEQKENVIMQIKEATDNEKLALKKEKLKAVQQTIVAQFPLNTECVYFGTIDNTNEANEKLIKFGHSNDLATRVRDHHKKYDNFILIEAFRVQNKVEIENLIKAHPKIKRHIREIQVNGKTKTEIIAYDSAGFTIEKLSKCIKDIIYSKTYCVDNYNRLMKQNEELESETLALRVELERAKLLITKQAVELAELKETIDKQNITLTVVAAESQSVYQNALLSEDEQTQKFAEFIATMCIVRPDVEEASTNMEGQFRIWSKTKPKKETFHALKNYLDTRFKPARISNQTCDQIIHGYIGVKLKEIVYKKKFVDNNAETFLFQVCKFSPNGKMLNSTLLSEYQRWKKSIGKPCSEDDMKELKDYLNSCDYTLKATVWTGEGSNEGYYGVMLKSDEHKHKATSTNGKCVEKRDKDNNVLGRWDTIAKAANSENLSTSKMSRAIKAGTKFNDDYCYVSVTN